MTVSSLPSSGADGFTATGQLSSEGGVEQLGGAVSSSSVSINNSSVSSTLASSASSLSGGAVQPAAASSSVLRASSAALLLPQSAASSGTVGCTSPSAVSASSLLASTSTVGHTRNNPARLIAQQVQPQEQPVPISALASANSRTVPELASVRINVKPKTLQNSKITSRITILNTTGGQQAVAPHSSTTPTSYNYPSKHRTNSISSSSKSAVTCLSTSSVLAGQKKTCSKGSSNSEEEVVKGGSDQRHSHLQHQTYQHPHHAHLHQHLHQQHPHHTTLRHVVSSAPYSLLSANSAVSYSISEEDEDEGFNEEAASTTSSNSSSSSSSNVDLNSTSKSTQPGSTPSLSEEKQVNESTSETVSEPLNSERKRSDFEEGEEVDPGDDDSQLPSIAHLTVSHQHPTKHLSGRRNNSCKDSLSTGSGSDHQSFEALALSIACCDTASSFQTMLHSASDEEEEEEAAPFAAAQNGVSNHQMSSLIIKGPTGSVRGKRNIVRKSISNYTQLVRQAVSLSFSLSFCFFLNFVYQNNLLFKVYCLNKK